MATFLKDTTFSGSNGSHFKARLEYSYSQSQANNTTTITYYLYFQSQDGWSGSGSANSITGYIGGTSSSDKVGTTNSIGVNATKLLGSRSYTITHNNDGTFPNTSYSARIDSAWNNVNRADISGTLTSSSIPQIKRYPMIIEAPNFNDEDNPKIKYTTALGFTGATVQAGIKVGDTIVVALRDVVAADGEYTFSLTTSERNALRNATPNSNTLTVQFLLRTTYNGTNYDSTSTQTMSIVNANPTATITTTEQNANVVSVLGGSTTNYVIANVSSLLFSVTATALKGSTISSVNVNGQLATLDNNVYKATLSGINTNTFVIEAIDSRGNTTQSTITKTLIAYSSVKINSWSIERETAISSDFILDADITCYSGTFNSTQNTATIKYSLDNENWNTIPSSSYTLSNNKIIINNYEIQNLISYQNYGTFYLYVEDLLTSNQENKAIAKGVETYSFGENDLQVNGDIYIADEDGDNPINVLDYIDNKNNYSTTEKIVGVWKDGRPIYRKVHNFTTTAGWQSFPKSTISNDIDRIVRIGGMVKQSNGTQVPIPYYINSSDYANVYYVPQSNYFVVTTGSSYGYGDTHIYVEYVKSS